MKILVTGATGFIGAAVARRLVQHGHTVLGLARSESAAARVKSAGLTPIHGDFAEVRRVSAKSRALRKVSPRIVTPVAAMIAALRDSGKPLIFTSGSAIFGVFTKGEASPTKFDEDHPVPLPASIFAPAEAGIPQPLIEGFGASMAPRAENEMAVLKATGIRGIVIRPGLTYGEGKGYDLPNLIALARKHGAAPYFGSGGIRQGFVHIDDLIDLYMLALDRAPGGSMLHGVTDEIALGNLAQAASRLVGAQGRTESLSLMEMYARGGGRGASFSVNKRLAGDKTRQLLSWSPKRYDILEDTECGSYNTSADEAQNIH